MAQASRKSGEVVIKQLCRPTLIRTLIKLYNSAASKAALLEIKDRAVDRSIQETNPVLLYMLLTQVCTVEAKLDATSPENNRSVLMNWQELWLSCGGLSFLIYQLEYFTTFEAARKASTHNVPSRTELAELNAILRDPHRGALPRLQSSYQMLMFQCYKEPWAHNVLSHQVEIQRLADLVCTADLASEQVGFAAPILICQLLQAPFTLVVEIPELKSQAMQVFLRAEAGSLLMRALRKWWLGPPQSSGRPTASYYPVVPEHAGDLQGAIWHSIAEVIITGSANTKACLDVSKPHHLSHMTSMPDCINILNNVLSSAWDNGTFAALVQLWGPGEARAPKLMAVLRDTVSNAAAWTPQGQAARQASWCPLTTEDIAAIEKVQPRVLYSTLHCLYMLAHQDGSLPDWMLRAPASPAGQAELKQGLRDLFHEPTMKWLVQLGAPELMEALLRTVARWHENWKPFEDRLLFKGINAMVGKLVASMGSLLAGTAKLKATLSLLATMRVILTVAVDHGSDEAQVADILVAYVLIALQDIATACSDQAALSSSSRGPAAVFEALGVWHRPRKLTPKGQAVASHISAWLLPVVLRQAKTQLAFHQWIRPVAQLVASLAASSALDDAAASLVCSWLVEGLQRADTIEKADMLVAVGLVSNLINQPVPSGCDATARRRAVVQSGLLRQLCKLASTMWAKEDQPATLALLAQAVLPALRALLPGEPEMSRPLQAVIDCFQAVEIMQLPELVGVAVLAAVRGWQAQAAASRPFHVDDEAKSAALRALATAVQALEAHCGPANQKSADADLERSRLAALGPGCHNPHCQNLTGACEADLATRKCSRCKKVQYCSAACQKAAWKIHKRVCKT
ncbi:hypothetical protein WJX72_004035 [[Myrmecia] bisecta]|uniref:MYND-type domain-containing protein n=1 Tax=[Myrmecia] bisecta TaxID=41462 RepID=A0AAW1PPP1_9CHLO